MGLFGKKEENPNILKKYSVLYLGGDPQNLKKTYNIEFQIMKDAFYMFSAIGDKKFAPINIPFNAISSLEVVQRQVSTAEGLLGGLDSRQLNQANNIHITYISNDLELTVRLEMVTGVTVMGQAGKCLELSDFLKTNGILNLFAQAKPQSVQTAPSSAADEILKLKALLDAGVLTEDEFSAKKKQLLNL